LEHQAAFVQALRSGGKMRKRMFDTIEQRHGHDFVSGSVGTSLYEELLSAVHVAGVPEAVEEFESRFFPLLHSDQARGGADVGAQEEMAPEHGTTEAQNRRWGALMGISAVCLVATVLIVGFRLIGITAAEQPGFDERIITAAKPTEAASETVSEPAQAAAAQAAIPAMDATEPASETVTEPASETVTEPASETTSEPVPAMSAEQKASED